MTAPIESAEAFVHECLEIIARQYPIDLGALIAATRSRDAAIRAEALREAADWLARCVPDEPSERNEWQRVLVEAADSLCAIADGAPKTPAHIHIPTLATKEPDDG